MNNKVLIIDDEILNIQLLAAILKPFDCKIFSTQNAVEGYDIFQKEKPEILFLDLNLPELHGKEFLRRINSEISSQNKVYIMSGDISPHLEEECKFLGADRIFRKPVNVAELRSVLHENLVKKSN